MPKLGAGWALLKIVVLLGQPILFLSKSPNLPGDLTSKSNLAISPEADSLSNSTSPLVGLPEPTSFFFFFGLNPMHNHSLNLILYSE